MPVSNQEKKSLSGNKTPHIVNKSSTTFESDVDFNSVKSSRQETNGNYSCQLVSSESERISTSYINTSATKRFEHTNSEVEQADSGIASPASEDGTDASRKGFSNPLDDILGRTELPQLTDVVKASGLGMS